MDRLGIKGRGKSLLRAAEDLALDAASAADSDKDAAENVLTDPESYARAYLKRSAEILAGIAAEEIGELIQILESARAERRQVFVCGNGGSAATATHFASGLGKDGSWRRERRFRALALTDNVPWITSLANDADYSDVFVEQLKNYAQAEDVLVAFSGSGNSKNVLRAMEWANDNGLVTVGITSRDGGILGKIARHRVRVPSDHLGHVEEGHFLIQHLTTYFFVENE